MFGEKYPWGRRPRDGFNGPRWTRYGPRRLRRPQTAPTALDGPRQPPTRDFDFNNFLFKKFVISIEKYLLCIDLNCFGKNCARKSKFQYMV